MRKIFLAVGLGFLMAGGVVASSQAAGTNTKKLHGHISSVVSSLKAKADLAVGTNLNLSIGLPLRNCEALTNLLQQIYDPSSTNFHRFITPDEFAARFGPTEQDYQLVAKFARANGLKITHQHGNRLLLDVSGKVSDIQNAFNTKLRVYRHPGENRDFFAPETEPSVDASLPIIDVSGLNNYSLARPAIKLSTAVKGKTNKPGAGSGPGGSYQGADFRKAYVPGTPLTGTGQNVALLQFDGFYPSDIAAYAAQIGLANPPNVVVVPVNGGVSVPGFGNGEVCLDIEMVMSMSPGVSNILVYEAPNPSPWETILNKIATDNAARQISCSWFQPFGGPNQVAEQIFQQMALQGQSFFTASGDSDAYTGLIPFPCDSPHITTVGGTTLTTGAAAAYTSETVWNWGIRYGADGIGSSGGISTSYTIPSWQTNINMATRGGSATLRNVPDVALTADDCWVIYDGGSSGSFGGTSCAAPLWAGFMALVNQQATNNGLAPIGFINPAVYKIAAGTNYANCFHDITTDNNKWSGSPNLFNAVSGYDLCTGLGTPNGTNLINALTAVGTTNSITHLSPPPPPYGSTLGVLNGGNPNGTWYLFVQDDALLDSGAISNGWILNLTTANPVGYSANLNLAMSAAPTNPIVGGAVVYVIGVTNYGPSISSNAIVSDNLPSGVSLVATNKSQGTVTRNGSQISWNVGTLASGGGAQLSLTVQVNSGGTLLNSAVASAETPDPNTDDNSATASINAFVPAPAVLSGASISNGVFRLTVTGTPGINYTVQASTNLFNWTSIYTNSSPFLFTDPYASSFPTRFYRTISGP